MWQQNGRYKTMAWTTYGKGASNKDVVQQRHVHDERDTAGFTQGTFLQLQLLLRSENVCGGKELPEAGGSVPYSITRATKKREHDDKT